MSNSETLGFYFVVFQTQFNNYVKCWIDGEEDYTLYTEEELLDFASKVDTPYPVSRKISDALIESSFFLWDVDANEVTRITPSKSFHSIREELAKTRDIPKLQEQPVANNNGVISLVKKYLSFL